LLSSLASCFTDKISLLSRSASALPTAYYHDISASRCFLLLLKILLSSLQLLKDHGCGYLFLHVFHETFATVAFPSYVHVASWDEYLSALNSCSKISPDRYTHHRINLYSEYPGSQDSIFPFWNPDKSVPSNFWW
jgi:hypothetical protein